MIPFHNLRRITIGALYVATFHNTFSSSDAFTLLRPHTTISPPSLSSPSLTTKPQWTTTVSLLRSPITKKRQPPQPDDVNRKTTTFLSTDNTNDSNSNIDESATTATTAVAQIYPIVEQAAISLRRACLLSWWVQVILTTVSAVTLLFARSVSQKTVVGGISNGGGFILAGTGIIISLLSIIWSYGGRRLSRRLLRRNTTPATASLLIQRTVTVGVALNLLGGLVTLLGAELIVGVLAARVLTSQGGLIAASGTAASLGGGGVVAALQPLDILIVQANTNTLLSHFCGLWLRLWYGRKWIGRLGVEVALEDESGKDVVVTV